MKFKQNRMIQTAKNFELFDKKTKTKTKTKTKPKNKTTTTTTKLTMLTLLTNRRLHFKDSSCETIK